MEIAIFGLETSAAKHTETPFGAVAFSAQRLVDRETGFFNRNSEPRARVYAAKEMGAERIVGVFNGVGLNPLLREGDALAPGDLIDQTRGGPTTFFANRGLGYVQMTPPFCSQTHNAIVGAICNRDAACSRDGIAIACPPRPITPAEAKAWRALGGDVAVWGLAPEWSLARELELCYAALVVIESVPDLKLLEPIIAALPRERACNCANLNPAAHGELGDNWRQWIEELSGS